MTDYVSCPCCGAIPADWTRDPSNEIERLREALQEIAKTDVQSWARSAIVKRDWALVERISEVDQQGIACRALAGLEARAALGEDKE